MTLDDLELCCTQQIFQNWLQMMGSVEVDVDVATFVWIIELHWADTCSIERISCLNQLVSRSTKHCILKFIAIVSRN